MDKSAGMKVREWKSQGWNSQEWKCRYEIVGMKIQEWKCGDENEGMKMWGWQCRNENAGNEKSGDEKGRGWKTGDESEKMKFTGMKCHIVTHSRIYHIDTFSQLSNLASNYFTTDMFWCYIVYIYEGNKVRLGLCSKF